jgi:PAS domain S-box-containing protein
MNDGPDPDRSTRRAAEEAAVGASAASPASDEAGDGLRALQTAVQWTARGTDQEFFSALVRHLAEAMDVHYAVAAEFPKAHTHVRTLAFWERDRVADNFDYDVTGTPCAELARGGLVHYPTGVSERFPGATPLVERGIDSYMAESFLDGQGNILGHLAVFDERPMPAGALRASIFRIFASRASAELERLRAEQRLRESEAAYRDLYENAPNAYLRVGTDQRILKVNRRATELLGYSKDELVGACIHDCLPDTPEGRSRSEAVHRALVAGETVSGWQLEMRRKDGRPLWIHLWVQADRGEDGTHQPGRAIFIDVTERVLADAERARLQEQNLYLQEEIKTVHNFEQIIGRSPALMAILSEVRRVAPTDASVLITGETGTGKELIARAIHSASKRRDKPLIKVNCAALPTGLVESELFGHEKGAFSGAIARRLGRFELADGGTIFLDEVGELALEAQVKLLRVLQEREFDRVGGQGPIPVDVRVIAATNRDLIKEVGDKRFREDLYYRLNVFPIRIPPLRERRDDIPLLVQFLLDRFTMRVGKRLDGVDRPTMQRLQDYLWPGNVRELENVLERAVILTTGPILEIDPGLQTAVQGTPPAGTQRPTLERMERDYVLTVLRETDWVIDGPKGAARILGLHPNTLRNRLKKLGIERDSHRPR